MSLIRWEERYSVRVPHLDQQHRHLVDLINQLYDAMRVGKGQIEMVGILDQLVEYTRNHFSSEEAFMRRQGFPGYAEHRAAHQRLTQQVLDFQTQYKSGEIGLSIPVIHFLRDWLVNHILGDDMDYSTYSQKNTPSCSDEKVADFPE
ncbi:MAG: bacteriohemerythrin [Chloroflexota bacterium]